jgi:hypothetical protein
MNDFLYNAGWVFRVLAMLMMLLIIARQVTALRKKNGVRKTKWALLIMSVVYLSSLLITSFFLLGLLDVRTGTTINGFAAFIVVSQLWIIYFGVD